MTSKTGLSIILLATFCLATNTSSFGQVVDTYGTDWASQSGSATGTQTFGGLGIWEIVPIAITDYTDPAEDYVFADVTAEFGVTGQWIGSQGDGAESQTATINLTGVNAFDSVSIDRLIVAAAGGLDAELAPGPDPLTILINGQPIVDELYFASRDRIMGGAFFESSYGFDAPAAAVLIPAVDEDGDGAPGSGPVGSGREFLDNRVGAWGHDSLYDLGMDPAFDEIPVSGAGDVTIEIIGGTTEGVGDELLAVANFEISFNSSGGGGVFETPSNLQVFRGTPVAGGLAEVLASDDLRAQYNPGFVLNNLEAPVWLIADGTLPNSSPGTLTFRRESNAGTPGLSVRTEAFNWNTNMYEELDETAEVFNTDAVVDVNLTSGISDYVDQAGAVRARIGWRQVGFVLNFPWEARVDLLGWEAN